MEKLVILLMILLFAVGLTSKTIYEDNGVQSDAMDMKDNTQTIIKNANTQMSQFGGSPTTPPTTP
ncbi:MULTISPECIES: hypothetical protein [Cytobacillus]|uniref:Uncharacterized protein n=1 Tax=Cytobacillus oceanisediminis TaxID=665099 RepID=A0ABX3CM74_9BACI|nr:hypothetical protein [Cytobacillus oceanisediminis]EFV75040.1 hypothetical protein HMPREF1013_04685 [Bacillus sp. 2_A_57_CT2]OHX44587.1 hypothetical protein BBV17_25525 [Cytobacillus oceanisediminis]